MTQRQRLFVVAGLLVSVVFLLVAFNGLSPALVLEVIRTANPIPLLLACVWYFAAVIVISARWGFLLRSLKVIPLRDLIPLVCIGYMGNNVYPFRSGELLRIVLLQRNHAIPVARATTVVIVERAFDGLVMLTFIVVALTFSNVASPEINAILSITAPLFILALLAFFVMASRPNLLRRLAQAVSRPLPGKLREIALHLTEEVIAGLEAFRTPADLVGAVITSYVSWMLEASVYWLVSFAFDMDISYGVALLVVGVVNLAGLIPASPGQFGVYEFFARTVLIGVGVADATATVYALTIHLVIWLPVTIVGFYFLARQGLNFNAVARARELEQKAAT